MLENAVLIPQLMEDGVELVFMEDGVMFVPVYGGPCSVSASLWRTV